jgi:hypothetical protein
MAAGRRPLFYMNQRSPRKASKRLHCMAYRSEAGASVTGRIVLLTLVV